MSGNGNISAIPMAKQSSETVENDLGKTLKSSKITSAIDFLKRMKLKKYISSLAGVAGTPLKEIVDFQSTDDERIQKIYAKLIQMYTAAEAEKAAAVAEPATPRTARNVLSNLYAQFGYKDLYEIAAVIAEIQRVKSENEDIMSSVKGIMT